MAEDTTAVPDDVVRELLAAGPDRFVSERNATAKRLRANGDRNLAGRVAKLRKPPKVVFELLDAVAANAAAAAVLHESAEAARDAQAAGRGADLRSAAASLREAIATLAAGDVDVAQALRQVASDPDAVDALRGGRLLALPGAGGLETFAGGEPQQAPAAPRPRPDRGAIKQARDVLRSAERDVARAGRSVDAAHARVESAKRELQEREDALARAEQILDDARRAVDDVEA